MATPVVIIEVAAPQANPSGAAALVRACDEAVRGGRCVLSRPGQDPPHPEAVAIVSWEDERHEHVRLEVGVRRKPNSEWLVREIDFNAEDAIVERWRATGLVIATLVGKLTGEDSIDLVEPRPRPGAPGMAGSSPSGSEIPREPGFGPSAQRGAVGRPRGTLWIDAGVLSGTGMEDGAWRSGLWAGASWRLRWLPIFIGFTADYSWVPVTSRLVGAQWLTLAAGVGGYAGLPMALQLDGRIDFIAERLSVEARHPVSSSEDRGQSWSSGIRLGLSANWPSDRIISPVVGFQWSLVEEGTVVRVAGTEHDRVPPWALRGLVGLRLRLP